MIETDSRHHLTSEQLEEALLFLSYEEMMRRVPYSRNQWINLHIRRVILEWPTRQVQPVQPRIREVAAQLNKEQIPSSRGGEWTPERLTAYMHFHQIRINDLLPEVPAWARTASDNERIRDAEREAGVEHHALSWSRKARPHVEAARLIKVRLTMARINQFFSAGRWHDPRLNPDNLILPQEWHYKNFPWEELCYFLACAKDTGPTNVPWKVYSIRRFLNRAGLLPRTLLNRYHKNIAVWRSFGEIDPAQDVVILPSEIERTVERERARYRSEPVVPPGSIMNPQTGEWETPLTTITEEEISDD